MQSMLRRWFVETEGAVKVGLVRGDGGCRRPVWQQSPCLSTLCPSQAYLWDNNQEVVQWLEQQWQEGDSPRSAVWENIKYLKRDAVLKTIRR